MVRLPPSSTHTGSVARGSQTSSFVMPGESKRSKVSVGVCSVVVWLLMYPCWSVMQNGCVVATHAM